MLKKRVIALILLKGDLVVQSIGFDRHLPIGKLSFVLEYLEFWDIDEVIVLDIDASKNGRTIDFDIVREASKKIFVPLTIGGGISSNKHIELAIHNGADKVVINSAFFENKYFIEKAVYEYGSQCIVLAADVRLVENNYFVYANNGRKCNNITIYKWLREAVDCGAGEAFINSIDNDGKKCGYDIGLVKELVEMSKIPIIAAGGAGCPGHVKELFESTDSAAAVGNILHYTEHSTSIIKSYLSTKNQNIRPSYFLNYEGCQFDIYGKLLPIEHGSIFNN